MGMFRLMMILDGQDCVLLLLGSSLLGRSVFRFLLCISVGILASLVIFLWFL